MRAITRQPDAVREPDVEIVPADLEDPPSLPRACEGADAVFFTSPSFTQAAKAADHCRRLGEAARDAGVRRVVYNTTSWHPEEPIGVPSMDWSYEKTAALRATGVPLTVVRPSLFMDNLLTRWVKPYLLEDGEFSYPHRPDLEVSWICLDDVARLMIATLASDDFAGETLDVGGPETLRPTEVARLLGDVLGRPVVYRQMRRGSSASGCTGVQDVSGSTGRRTCRDLEKHYLFKNETNPFRVDMGPVLERIPIRLTPMRSGCRSRTGTPASASHRLGVRVGLGSKGGDSRAERSHPGCRRARRRSLGHVRRDGGERGRRERAYARARARDRRVGGDLRRLRVDRARPRRSPARRIRASSSGTGISS